MSARRALRDSALMGAVLVAAALLQVTIAGDFALLGGAPDLLAVVAFSFALLRGAEAGAAGGFAAGLLLDLLTGQPLGLGGVVYTLLGYWTGRFGERVSRSAPVRPLLAVGSAALLARAGLGLLSFLLGSQGALGEALNVSLVPVCAFGVLLAIPVYPLLRRALAQRPAVPPVTTTTPSERVPSVLA